MQKTTIAKGKESLKNRGWVVINLDGKVLGRAATQIADILRGKKKTIFTPHEDTGDFVVAINAQKIVLTGKKLTDKIYYKHTGFRGGIKQTTAGKLLTKDATQLVRKAVFGMLPTNKSTKHLMKKLKIYSTAEHPHISQQPKEVKI